MPVDETRAVAKLPHVDIEIRHKKAPEEGAEYLAVTLRASPDFETAASLFDPFRLVDPMRFMAAWAGFNPWRAWMRLADPFGFWQLGGPAKALLGQQKNDR